MITCLLIVAALCRLLYWLYFFVPLARHRSQVSVAQGSFPDVSVIICSKDGLSDLKTNLPEILDQNYPNYEVIVVDDHSTDGTLQYLHSISDSKLKSISCTRDIPGKKAALAEGIAASSHPYILLTDVDCRPLSPLWIKTMLTVAIKEEADMVLGYGPMSKTMRMVNAFSRYETLYTAMQYMGFALRDLPYMGVGRNLLYKRELYDKVGGFSSHEDIASGDDDLFVQDSLAYGSVAICLHPQSFVYSPSKQDLGSFLKQKTRHISTSTSYSWIHKILLAGISGSHIVYFAMLAIALFCGLWPVAVAIHSIMLLLMWIIAYPIGRKTKSKELITYLPVFDMLMAVYYTVLACLPIFTKRNKWI